MKTNNKEIIEATASLLNQLDRHCENDLIAFILFAK